MRTTVKNFPCSADGISYDDNLRDKIVGAGLVDTTPNGEQFHLSTCHKWSIMNCFGERAIR